VILKDEQKRALLFGHSHADTLTSRQYQSLCGMDIYQASRDIKDLVKKGILALPKKGGRVYSIAKEPIPLRKTEQQIRKSLAPIFEELKGKELITNSDIQKVLKISRVQASRIARELVEWGLLVRQGRGRGVHYKRAPK
jgi:Fic family protein